MSRLSLIWHWYYSHPFGCYFLVTCYWGHHINHSCQLHSLSSSLSLPLSMFHSLFHAGPVLPPLTSFAPSSFQAWPSPLPLSNVHAKAKNVLSIQMFMSMSMTISLIAPWLPEASLPSMEASGSAIPTIRKCLKQSLNPCLSCPLFGIRLHTPRRLSLELRRRYELRLLSIGAPSSKAVWL